MTQSVHPRALEPEKLLELAAPYGITAEAVIPLEKAVERALDVSRGKQVILVTGSLFIVAGVRQEFERRLPFTKQKSSIRKGETVH